MAQSTRVGRQPQQKVPPLPRRAGAIRAEGELLGQADVELRAQGELRARADAELLARAEGELRTRAGG